MVFMSNMSSMLFGLDRSKAVLLVKFSLNVLE